LFHPRKQRWHEHFYLQDEGRIEGLTPFSGDGITRTIEIHDHIPQSAFRNPQFGIIRA
jgi:hypothetical protein